MRPALLRLGPLALGLALLAGCGYRLVREADAPAVRLGPVDDQTPYGDLGLRAAAELRRLARVRDDARFELRGVVRPGPDAPALIGTAGERARSVGVEVELSAHHGRRLVATSGPVRRARPVLLAADPTATAAARRRAIEEALADATREAIDRLAIHLPPEDET